MDVDVDLAALKKLNWFTMTKLSICIVCASPNQSYLSEQGTALKLDLC